MKKFFETISEKISEINEIREKHLNKKIKKTMEQEKSLLNNQSKTEKGKLEIEVAAGTVVKILIIIAIFFALGEIFIQLKSILIVTIICFFLAMGLAPIVSAIEKRHIPRPVAILILYLVFLGVITILFVQIVPILAEQLFSIAYDLKEFFSSSEHAEIPLLDNVFRVLQFDPQEAEKFIADNLTAISKNLQSVAGSTFLILSGIFQGVFNFIFALVVLFFILMEREQIGHFFLALIPSRERKYFLDKTMIIQKKMSDWFRGQIILMISIGLAMYVGMKIFEHFFDMPYAATIGLLAGIMELFPYVGVLITGILSGLIALNVSWILMLLVIGWMILVQFLEGNLLVPLVMEKVTGLPSVVIILALAVGGVLGNAAGGVPLSILGMILSIPVAASVGIFVDEYAKKKH